MSDKEKAPHVTFNSGNNEWYTPGVYVEAVRKVMGSIDLDPASCDEANEIVRAAMYYTAENDGLVQKWTGNVFMNPPYSRKLLPRFCEKYAEEFYAGNIKQGIVLVNNATETEWFSILADVSAAVVFVSGRIRFYSPGGKRGAPLQGQVFLYAGDNSSGFIKAFSGLGIAARFVMPYEYAWLRDVTGGKHE